MKEESPTQKCVCDGFSILLELPEERNRMSPEGVHLKDRRQEHLPTNLHSLIGCRSTLGPSLLVLAHWAPRLWRRPSQCDWVQGESECPRTTHCSHS